jgi:hypothetical protein
MSASDPKRTCSCHCWRRFEAHRLQAVSTNGIFPALTRVRRVDYRMNRHERWEAQ